MFKQLTTLLTLFFATVIFAQDASVTGTITDSNNNPLFGVNVYLKGTTTGVQTDENGKFNLKTEKGAYTLVVSYLGYKTKEISITAPSDLSTITLLEGNEILQEVILTARKNKFSRKKTAYVSKLPLKDLENPHVYSSVSNELLQSQIVTSFDEALTNATGISKLWESTGRSVGNGSGFFSTRGFSSQPSFVDGMPGYTFSALDPTYVERIEVIKGPSATLFGSTFTSLGGLINVVTKKTYEGQGGSVSFTGGSFGMNRISLDINTPTGDKNSTYFRIIASYLDQDSFQDNGFRRSFLIAPSLTYRVNNKLNLSLGLELTRNTQTNPSMLFLRRGLPMVSRTIEDLGIDPRKSFTSDDVFLSNPNLNTRFIADYKLSDNWSSKTLFANSVSSTKGTYQYLIDGAPAAFSVLSQLSAIPGVTEIIDESNALLQDDNFLRLFEERDTKALLYNIQQNFTGDFKIVNMRNRMVIGADFVYYDQDNGSKVANPVLATTSNFPSILQILNFVAGEDAAQQLEAQLNSFPYFDSFFKANGDIIPSSITPNATYEPNRSRLDEVFNQIPWNRTEVRYQTLAGYVSNVLNITPNLTVNLGLRLDYFNQEGDTTTDDDDYNATELSPNAGIVFQAIPKQLSLFANYQTGFVQNNPTINIIQEEDPQNPGQIISRTEVVNVKPTKAKQFEAGIKTNLFDGRLNLGASYYHIIAEDRLGSDPRVPIIPTSLVLDEVVSNGLEFEVNANPINGLNIRASYSKNNTEITEAILEELKGRRPEAAGPESVYNFWADYKFQEGSFLKNFGVGAGFNGASEHMPINNGVSGVFTLPSYTIYNASIYYQGKQYRVGFKINNLTNEEYYTGWSTVNPQAPRAFFGTISYKF